MKAILIAQIAHAVNLAYCASLGDLSQSVWEEAADWQKQSALAGVDMHLANPDATPEQSHESWLAQKVADGWVYGPVKVAEAKQHPCCLPYAELPPEQKAKDYLFRGVVHALKDLPDAEDAAGAAKQIETLQAQVVELRQAARAACEQVGSAAASAAATSRRDVLLASAVDVQYVGRRPWTDNLYGSGLPFVTDQVRSVPGPLARQFLRHRDVFKEATAEALATVVPEQVDSIDDTLALLELANQRKADDNTEQNALQDLRDNIMQMDKAAVQDFAMTKYRIELPKRATLPELREKAIGLIDQYGAV